jgi:hypothetical protein
MLSNLVTFVVPALAWALHRRRETQPAARWEIWLANELSRDLLGRYDWRRSEVEAKPTASPAVLT